MYLELAENNNQNYYSMMAQQGEDVSDLYVYIPAQFTEDKEGMYVREDSFDMLSPVEWDQLQDVLDPFQERNLSLFGLGRKGRARRERRRAERHVKKVERMGIRSERITIRGKAGGGALGKIGSAISRIFGGGGGVQAGAYIAPAISPEGVPYEPGLVYQPPPEKKTFNLLGMKVPVATAAIGGVGALILILAMMGRRRGKKKK